MIVYILFCSYLCTAISASETFIIQGTNPPSLLNTCGIGKPETWSLQVPYTLLEKSDKERVAVGIHRFKTLRSIIEDLNEKPQYEIKSHYCTKKQVADLINIVLIPEKTKNINSVIHTSSELIHYIFLADNLDAGQSIKETILESQYTEQLINDLERNASIKDFVSNTISQSKSLKKRFEPCFYRLLYTCPEWIKTYKKLRCTPTLKKTVSVPEQSGSVTLIYNDPSVINATLLEWQQKSQWYILYNKIFDNECLKNCDYYCEGYKEQTEMILDKGNAFEYDNTRNKFKFVRNINRVFVTYIQGSRLHLPLLSFFIECLCRIENIYSYNKESSRIDKIRFKQNPVTNKVVFLDAVDVQALEQYQKITEQDNEEITIEIPNLDATSISCFQASRHNRLVFFLSDTSYDNPLRSILLTDTPSSFIKHGNYIYAIDPQWRFKIILPWIAMSIGALCGSYALWPRYTSALEYVSVQTASILEHTIQVIQNLHITSAERALVNKICISHGVSFEPIEEASRIPHAIPQQTYSAEQVDKSFQVFNTLRTNCWAYNDALWSLKLKGYGISVIYGISMALCAKIAYTLYKKCVPNIKLFNPLKVFLPTGLAHHLDVFSKIFWNICGEFISSRLYPDNKPPLPTVCKILLW